MCGRYTLTANKTQIAEEFKLHEVQLEELAPQYNIAPGTSVPILLEAPEPRVEMFRWGFVPSWAKDSSIGSQLINARKETLAEKPSFKGPLANQRCLILADGFYEWKKEGLRNTPYYIRLKSKLPFGFAGLWSRWKGKDGSELDTCAIITGEPNTLIAPIHNRMPILLDRARRSEWLNPSLHDLEMLVSLLESCPAEEMEAFPVSRLVNSPEQNTPECVLPLK